MPSETRRADIAAGGKREFLNLVILPSFTTFPFVRRLDFTAWLMTDDFRIALRQ
jgi:hypothetical protein